MKTNNQNMSVSLLALAIQGALLAMFAMPAHAADAADDEVAALKRPVNSIEIGATNVSQKSAKFGEFNGMNKSAATVIGNFSLKGGDAYNPFGESGTTRWGIYGTDLGTTSRALGGSIGSQGKWDLSIGYDEMRHNISDTYQTPYLGAMGGNSFTLPTGFGPVANTKTGLTPAKLAAFHNMDLSASRKNTNVGAGVVLNDEWSVKVDYNQQVQTGAKLIGFGSMLNAAAVGVAGEGVSILPTPTNYKTDSVNLALNWLGENAHATGSYFGSFFRDANNGVNFQTFTGTGPAPVMQTMSTAPGNDFHQLNLSGGYKLTPTTKLTGGLSYAKNTQNTPYAGTYDAYAMVGSVAPPVASLNGDVRTTHADLKLVDQTTKALTLSAAVKFDERNNKTASNFYNMYALDGAANHMGNFANAPVSNSKTQLELAGDLRIDKDQLLKLAYNREDVKRWCNQYAVGGLGANNGVAGGLNQYLPGTNCVVAVASKDDKVSASYKLKASDAVNLNVGYSYSQRTTTSDVNAVTVRIGLNGNVAPIVPANSIQGLNAGDFRGFYPFFNASRKQQMLKGGVNWQTNEKLTLGLGGRITDDKYDSLYGVKAGNSWSLNLDADYSYSENGSLSVYLTQEHKQRDMTDLQNLALITATATRLNVPANSTWSDRQKDDDTTIGLALKQNGLMDAKLDLTGDLSYSLGRTTYSTQLNYAGLTTGGLTCSNPILLSCGSLPTIKNDVIQLKLTGKYKVSKSGVVTVAYMYQQMRSTDYYYNGLQTGFNSNTMLPTNQQAPNYKVNVIAASYSYLF
jgi:MtrB/PioB family decaheme-associated outer membrane protein